MSRSVLFDSEEGSYISLRTMGLYPNYMALELRRLCSSFIVTAVRRTSSAT
jgi:hypothetical protein